MRRVKIFSKFLIVNRHLLFFFLPDLFNNTENRSAQLTLKKKNTKINFKKIPQ